ncbi:MAG: hypothetical protein HWE18_14130 [Gammaproteobacteria bacterium]|nr:hypothetical protein [Gammaproteobacteria bacterium]
MRPNLKSFIFLLFMQVSSVSLSQTITLDAAAVRANDALSELARWQNSSLRSLLINRIQENEYLVDVLMEIDLIGETTEVDTQFDYAVKTLLSDQLGLSYFAKNIAIITRQESLDIDEFMAERDSLKQEYQESLNYSQGITSSKHLVNRLLYLSLMEKYAGI